MLSLWSSNTLILLQVFSVRKWELFGAVWTLAKYSAIASSNLIAKGSSLYRWSMLNLSSHLPFKAASASVFHSLGLKRPRLRESGLLHGLEFQ